MTTLELSCFALTALLQIVTFLAMVWKGEKSLRTVEQSSMASAELLDIKDAGIELSRFTMDRKAA